MSTVDDIREEAASLRKWASEKSDWLENPAVLKRYEGDRMSIARRHAETTVVYRAAERLDSYAQVLTDRANTREPA